jgi:septum formation protein
MIILASQSQTRRHLLNQAGVPFTAKSPDLDEQTLKTSLPTVDGSTLALSLAKAKSLQISLKFPADLVIGADQTLSCNGKLFNKPEDHFGALKQLQHLKGKTHSLHSAVAVSFNNKLLFEHCANANLTMRDFSDDFLKNYLEKTGTKVTQCVGSYQIESLGVNLFSAIEGDYFTILGLPLVPLLAFLRDMGELPS